MIITKDTILSILSLFLKGKQSNIKEKTPKDKKEKKKDNNIDLSRIKYSCRLKGVNKNLLLILSEVSKIIPLTIPLNGGLRKLEVQKKLVKKGVSKTLKSKHLKGLAVDVCPYYNNKIDWNGIEDFSYMCGVIKAIAILKGINIRQGCKWDYKTIKANKFRDYGHFELK